MDLQELLNLNKKDMQDIRDWLGALGLLGPNYEERMKMMNEGIEPGDEVDNPPTITYSDGRTELLGLKDYSGKGVPDLVWNEEFKEYFDDPDLVGNIVDDFSNRPKVKFPSKGKAKKVYKQDALSTEERRWREDFEGSPRYEPERIWELFEDAAKHGIYKQLGYKT